MAVVAVFYRVGASIAGVLLMSWVYAQGVFEEFWEAYVRAMEEAGVERVLVYEEDVQHVLRQLVDQPIDLNSADRSDFEQIPFLDWEAIEAILEYRHRFGPYESVWELNAVRGLEPEQCRLLRYVVRVAGGSALGAWMGGGGVRTLHTGEVENGRVLLEGSRFQWDGAFRNRIRGHLGIYWPHRTQPWEEWRRWLHLQLRAFGVWQPNGATVRLYFGDFTVRLGEGLLCYQGFHLGQSIHVLSIVKGRAQVIRPYRSRSNYGFLRGIGFEWTLHPRWKLHIAASLRNMRWFWSRSKQSYWVVGEPRYAPYKMVDQRVDVATGIVNTRYSGVRGSVEANVLLHRFGRTSLPLSLLAGGSVAHRWHMRGVLWYGEGAWWSNGAHGFVQGLALAMRRDVHLSVQYRYMSARYPMLWVAPIMRGSYPAGERGWYLGVEWQLARRSRLHAFVDLARFKGTSVGYVPIWRLYYIIKINRRHQWSIDIRQRQLRREVLNDRYGVNQYRAMHILRFEGRHQWVRQWEYRWSMHYGLNTAQRGLPQITAWMVAQNWQYTSRKGRWRWRGQVALFEIADFRQRMYLYVPGSLGIGRFAAFYGNGAHILHRLVVKLPREHRIECLVRWSVSTYLDKERRQFSWQLAWSRRW